MLMKQRVEEMEREAKKLRELQAAAAESSNAEGAEGEGGEPMETDEDKSLADSRSVFVGNVSMADCMVCFY
jgi:polyadenylate-binding protein 2